MLLKLLGVRRGCLAVEFMVMPGFPVSLKIQAVMRTEVEYNRDLLVEGPGTFPECIREHFYE